MANAPGKNHRKGLSLIEITRMFPDDRTAEQWFIGNRWPDGVTCPQCESDNVQARPTRKPQPFRCRDCRKDFSTKTGTLMQGSNLGFQTWAIALFLLHTGLKGTASMKLHRDLKITQKSAWHLAHRIRETWKDETAPPFRGPIEIDEAYFGGIEGNKHQDKKLNAGRGTVGKTAVVGVKDRKTNEVRAAVIPDTTAETLQGFAKENVRKGGTMYSDDATAYTDFDHVANHESVKHSVGEYVRKQAHVNGMESFWSMAKRGFHGTYHRWSPKHLHRYIAEFAGRHNDREEDTIVQMNRSAARMDGRRLRYEDLIA